MSSPPASRVVLTATSVLTVLGTTTADLNATHVFSPRWTGHARFHGIASWGATTGGQVLALWLLWRPARSAAERDLAVTTAALLPVLAWTPMFLALATPGTAIGDDPDHLPTIAGVPAQVLPAVLFPALAGLGWALHRRGR